MKVEHIAMYVNDLNSARDFFQKYFYFDYFFILLFY